MGIFVFYGNILTLGIARMEYSFSLNLSGILDLKLITEVDLTKY